MLKRNLKKEKKQNLNYNIMKSNKLRLLVIFLLLATGSCNDPKTVVTDIVNPDGSILRKLEIRNSENNLTVSNTPIPYDSTWIIRDSVEISPKGDTTWVRRAQKLFRGAEEISKMYRADSSFNKHVPRSVEFHKKFRWFNTEYSFSEILDKKLIAHGYPVSDFLNTEELKWFYSPDNLNQEKLNGPDSLKFRAFGDTVKKKIERWQVKSVVSELIYKFVDLSSRQGKPAFSIDSLKKHENDFCRIINSNADKFDSIWTDSIIGRAMIGEKKVFEFKSDIDSALKTVTDKFFVDFREYTLKTLMPGKLTSATGMIDSSGMVIWPVKSDYFLTQPYVMKAESKILNRWAWILSGLFLLFVLTGILFRKSRKG